MWLKWQKMDPGAGLQCSPKVPSCNSQIGAWFASGLKSDSSAEKLFSTPATKCPFPPIFDYVLPHQVIWCLIGVTVTSLANISKVAFAKGNEEDEIVGKNSFIKKVSIHMRRPKFFKADTKCVRQNIGICWTLSKSLLKNSCKKVSRLQTTLSVKVTFQQYGFMYCALNIKVNINWTLHNIFNNAT